MAHDSVWAGKIPHLGCLPAWPAGEGSCTMALGICTTEFVCCDHRLKLDLQAMCYGFIAGGRGSGDSSDWPDNSIRCLMVLKVSESFM